jgi:hypothetical protein
MQVPLRALALAAAAAAASSDDGGDGAAAPRVRALAPVAEALAHASWEYLHMGDWHAVSGHVRRAFALGARAAGAAAAEAGDVDKAMRLLDLGLMMGGPDGQEVTHALIGRIEDWAVGGGGGGGGGGALSGAAAAAGAAVASGGGGGGRARSAGGGKAPRPSVPVLPPPPLGDNVPRVLRPSMLHFQAAHMTPRCVCVQR